jgi:hypothetical protein
VSPFDAKHGCKQRSRGTRLAQVAYLQKWEKQR